MVLDSVLLVGGDCLASGDGFAEDLNEALMKGGEFTNNAIFQSCKLPERVSEEEERKIS